MPDFPDRVGDRADGQPFGVNLAVLAAVPDFALPVAVALQCLPHGAVKVCPVAARAEQLAGLAALRFGLGVAGDGGERPVDAYDAPASVRDEHALRAVERLGHDRQLVQQGCLVAQQALQASALVGHPACECAQRHDAPSGGCPARRVETQVFLPRQARGAERFGAQLAQQALDRGIGQRRCEARDLTAGQPGVAAQGQQGLRDQTPPCGVHVRQRQHRPFGVQRGAHRHGVARQVLPLQHPQAVRGDGAAGQQCFPHAVTHEGGVRLVVEDGAHGTVVWHAGVDPVDLAVAHATAVQFEALQVQSAQRFLVHRRHAVAAQIAPML